MKNEPDSILGNVCLNSEKSLIPSIINKEAEKIHDECLKKIHALNVGEIMEKEMKEQGINPPDGMGLDFLSVELSIMQKTLIRASVMSFISMVIAMNKRRGLPIKDGLENIGNIFGAYFIEELNELASKITPEPSPNSMESQQQKTDRRSQEILH